MQELNDRQKKLICQISELLAGVPYWEWARIRQAVEKKYSSASNRVELPDAKELVRAISLEF